MEDRMTSNEFCDTLYLWTNVWGETQHGISAYVTPGW